MKFTRIRTKIFAAMIAVILLPLGIASMIIWYQISDGLKEDLRFAETRTEQDLKGAIDEYILALNETAYQIYSNPDLIKSLTHHTSYSPDESRTYDTVRDMREFFLSVYNKSRVKDIVGMYLINAEQEAAGDFFPSLSPRLSDEYIRQLLLESKRVDSRPTFLFTYDSMYGEPVIQYLYPVKSLGVPTGLLVIDMKESYFRQLVEKYNSFYNGSVIITEKSGAVVYHTDREAGQGSFSPANLPGKPFVIETDIGGGNWLLYYVFYEDPEVSVVRLWIIIAIALSAVLALVASYTLSYSITKPIVRMYRKMGLIQRGDYSVRVQANTNDEIGFLGNQFNKMVETMQQLIDHELKLQLTNQESQIKALQAQISPHFLFNTLQTMSNIAQVNNVPDLKLICQSLSDMYRYNMHIRNEWVQLKDEILHIRNYMVIINKRYPESIRIRFQVDPAIRSLAIPKLILQPMVENAVEHGLIPKLDGKKLIKIHAAIDAEQDRLYISVLDNGIGMDKERLEGTRQSLAEEAGINSKDKEDSSIGMINVHTRIRLICGEPYGLNVYSKNGKGTCIRFVLPMKNR
ncbi:sensor histidine kinase [Paenibacillus sp. M1]|uniref:Sensor histidine kinase n=1 Tax=Paenibacillus haidiansis TaxID=1574488 RepID=A0ABU7VR79_9BACL